MSETRPEESKFQDVSITRHPLLEVGVRPAGLGQAASLLGHPAGQRERDLGVVHLGDERTTALAGSHHLAADDLDGVGPREEDEEVAGDDL